MPIHRARLTGILITILVLALDLWSKATAMAAAHAGSLPLALCPFFSLVLVQNPGISFGMFARMPATAGLILTCATSLITLLLMLWLLRTRESITALALGFIIGGAVGNILDRLRGGAVIDFLDVHLGALHWPAFNLADSAIFMGVVILVLRGIVGPAEKNP